MSTTPTALSETTAATLESTLAAAETTAAAEELLDIESIKALLDGFDPGALLPDLSKVFSSLEPLCRIAVLMGPVVLLLLGLSYLILSPKEANYYLGYRCYYGMGSEYAWRFTQRCAGMLFTGAGLVLTVVVFTVSAGFSSMELTDMVWRAAACLLVELVLSVVLILAVNISAAVRFDRKGNYRRKRK